MQPPETGSRQDDPAESPFIRAVGPFLDPDWYRARYPDIAANELDPYQHFIRYGAAEKRDPNRFFDTAWYVEHYPDVAASGLNPLLHYAQAGAAELRNPHPKFDAAYYVDQHPDAAANPLLYHLRVGMARGYATERSIDIRDYLPSEKSPLPVPRGLFADVVIPVCHGLEATMRRIRSVLADRALPLARIIVVDDRSPEPELTDWLDELAREGQIHLIRNRRHLGFPAAAARGIEAAESHDVVLLNSATEVPAGWLRRLAAHAYAHSNVATVSPLSDSDPIQGAATGQTLPDIDQVCQTINQGRSADVPAPMDHCLYIRRAAMLAAGGFGAKLSDFGRRATAAGWRHRLACDTIVHGNSQELGYGDTGDVIAFRFAVTAALFRESKLPVILMVSHNFGGGVGRHITSLVERYRDTARVLLLQGTERGATLSVGSSPDDAVLALSADRLDDLIIVLRSTNLSRVHIHHLLRMDMDIRALVHRMGLPFDVTVHDYFAICPQIYLLRWSEGIYCGEPGPAVCNACIAEQSSHGARDIVSWRRERTWQFTDADRVICPSLDVKLRLDRHGVGRRAIVVPHEPQTEAFWTTRLPEFPQRSPAPPLRIVLLGVLANRKGARAVAEVAETAAPGTIEIHLIGHLEAGFPKPARKLIRATGQYQDRDLPAILRRIAPHVFWFPSSGLETYSYTLSAAIATGLPIVATDLGSFTERLTDRPNTWLVDHRGSAKDWLAAFADVRTTLRDRPEHPPAPRPRIVSDFYAERYLSPAAPPLPGPATTPPHWRATDPARKPRITLVPERYRTGGLTPCAYIRMLQPLDHPAIGGGFDVILADTETVFDYEADIIATQRYAIPDLDTADRLAAHASRTGAKLLYDLDDDLLNIPETHPDARTLRPFARTVRRMLMVSDAVWVSTLGLAKRLAPVRADTIVIENRLDERIWAHGPAPHPAWDHPVRILCMGTQTHDRDFAMIEPALLRLKAEHGPRVVIDVLGMTSRSELPAELNRIGPSTHGSRSYPGFVNWMTSMRPRWHIGLAPLLDTTFNRSKSPIKAMDYAAMGLAVLASDTPVYRGSIADGPAGLLVANDHRAWHAALDWLVRDQALREATVTRTREAFLTRASLSSQADIRLAALTQLLPHRGAIGDFGLQDAPQAPNMDDGSADPVARARRVGGRRR